MANKKSTDNPATKGDLVVLATKKELKKTERVLRDDVLRVEVQVENIEEKVNKMDAKLDKISSQLDGFVGRVDDLTNDNEIGAEQIHELRETAKDHEKRITKLESSN